MRRRCLAAVVGVGLVAWPFLSKAPAPAQTLPVIGFLNSVSSNQFGNRLAAFHQGLADTGYAEGRNVAIEYRWADGHYDRLPALAADLVRRKVNVIVGAGGAMSATAAKAETPTIPILFVSGSDPVVLGLVDQQRAGPRNTTGLSLYTTVLATKRLELIREMVPGAAKIAMLVNPGSTSTEIEVMDVGAATRNDGIELIVLEARSESEFAPAFAAVSQAGADTLLVSADPLFTSRRARLVELAAQHAVRVIYPWREYVEAGGLMSYGPRLSDIYRELGRYAGRILKGAAPADLPIQLPRRFELVINMRTAKSLGLTVSPLLLARADELIE